MIELENDRVALAAVDAWMVVEVLDQKFRPLRVSPPVPCLRETDVLLTVRQVVLASILGLTGSAVVVALALRTAAPGEVRERLVLTASSTSAHRDNATF